MIPGTPVRHRFITDACREGKGDDGALAEAIEDVRREAALVLSKWPLGRGMRLHIAVTVERPTRRVEPEGAE